MPLLTCHNIRYPRLSSHSLFTTQSHRAENPGQSQWLSSARTEYTVFVIRFPRFVNLRGQICKDFTSEMLSKQSSGGREYDCSRSSKVLPGPPMNHAFRQYNYGGKVAVFLLFRPRCQQATSPFWLSSTLISLNLRDFILIATYLVHCDTQGKYTSRSRRSPSCSHCLSDHPHICTFNSMDWDRG